MIEFFYKLILIVRATCSFTLEKMSEKKKPEDEEVGGLDTDNPPRNITLISNNGEKFTLLEEHAKISHLVKEAVEQDSDAKEVPLPSVSSAILDEVVKFMQHHKGEEPPIIPKPLRSKEMKEVCKDPWDATFIDSVGENRQKLYDLILAANYMDIKSLLHLGCAKVASLIKGQPLEKIKGILQPEKPSQKKEESA